MYKLFEVSLAKGEKSWCVYRAYVCAIDAQHAERKARWTYTDDFKSVKLDVKEIKLDNEKVICNEAHYY